MEESKLEIICPCCESTILVDRATGIVLRHDAKADPKNAGSIAEIMESLAAKKESSEKLFAREMSSMKDRGRLLDEKLQEAVKRAKESKDEKPIRPIDLE
jgi:hypothetical protein